MRAWFIFVLTFSLSLSLSMLLLPLSSHLAVSNFSDVSTSIDENTRSQRVYELFGTGRNGRRDCGWLFRGPNGGSKKLPEYE